MGPLLEELSCEKKEIILKRDFNTNLLTYDSDKDTTDFVDTMYASSFYPTINTPTRITATSKTLIDNIFYNDFTKNVVAGNITTSASDHLTQYLIIKEQTTNFEGNREKGIPNLADLSEINWHNYLKIYKNDTDLSFELFLRKINLLYNKHSPLVTSKRKIKKTPQNHG